MLVSFLIIKNLCNSPKSFTETRSGVKEKKIAINLTSSAHIESCGGGGGRVLFFR